MSISAQFEGMHVSIPITNKSIRWVDLPPGKDIALVFSIKRENKCPKDLKVVAPKFPKVSFL